MCLSTQGGGLMNSSELINLIADLKKIEDINDINLIRQAVSSCLIIQQLKKRFLENKDLFIEDNF